MSLQIFPLLFFLISWSSVFLFSISDCRFRVSTSVFRSLSWNLSIRSSISCWFSDSSLRSRPVPLTCCLVFDLYLFMRAVKWSLRLYAFTNSSQLFKWLAIYPTSRFPPLLAIPLIIQKCYDMIDLRKGEHRILLYKLFKTWRQKAIPRIKKSNVKWK